MPWHFAAICLICSRVHPPKQYDRCEEVTDNIDAEDFYEDNRDDFEDYYDAEDYYEDAPGE